MVTFIICLVILIASYFTYGYFVSKIFRNNNNEEVPSKRLFDGVDYIPMPAWKTFLIQLLNIAGLGPIFGAILGAAYGPVAFLWITLGGIFMGAVQDYASGMISLYNNGMSFPEIVGKYLGLTTKQIMRGFTLFLMILVGTVFMAGPAGILQNLTGINGTIWLWIIIAYYLLATLLPIDKIIGKIYPVFGFALLFMAFSILGVIFSGNYSIPELTFGNLKNMNSDTISYPLFPTLFVTIACGAISGFHATQSPMMARCLTSRKQGRPVFFGAMISESIIALIWAAIGMSFFGNVKELNDVLAANNWNAANIVDTITSSTLGKFGSILAIIGVVAAPITSGDTAFRTARLIIADFLHIDQRKLIKRIYISLPVFIVALIINSVDFDVIWRYFGWANQVLAAMALWAIAAYLIINRKPYLFVFFPAIFMTFIVSAYISGNNGIGLNYNISIIISILISIVIAATFYKRYKNTDSPIYRRIGKER